MSDRILVTRSSMPEFEEYCEEIGSVEKVGVEPHPKRVGPASWNLEYG